MQPLIKAIVFDLGNVIVDIAPEKSRKAVMSLMTHSIGIEKAADYYQSYSKKMEIGEWGIETLINHIQRNSHLALQAQSVLDAWNAMLLGVPVERIDLLKKLRKQFSLYILSNTDPIHMQWIRRHVANVHQVDDFANDLFDGAFFSYEHKLAKPQLEFYRKVADALPFSTDQWLFIDDKSENVTAARQADWQAWQHRQQEEDLLSLLSRILPQTL